MPRTTAGTRTTFNALQSLPVIGAYASVPDSSALEIIGDIDIRVWFSSATYNGTITAYQTLVCKRNGNSVVEYALRLNNSSTTTVPVLYWYNSGGTSVIGTCSVPYPLAVNQWGWLRATRGASSTQVIFYTSPDGVNWTQLGTTQSTSGAPVVSSNPVLIGAYSTTINSQTTLGSIGRVQIYSGINGSLQLDANFTKQSIGATSFTESSTNAATVTITGQDTIAPWRNVAVTRSQANTAIPYQTVALSYQPINLWMMNNTTADIGPLAQNGTGANLTATPNQAGTANSAYLFNGANSAISLPSSVIAINNTVGVSLSISLWYESTQTNGNTGVAMILSRSNGGSPQTDYEIFIQSNLLTWGTGSSSDTVAWMNVAEPTRNVWHHVVATIQTTGASTGTKTLYIDGALQASGTYSVKSTSTNPPYIGQFAAGAEYYWTGSIAEMAFFPAVLTANQVLNLYHAGLGTLYRQLAP